VPRRRALGRRRAGAHVLGQRGQAHLLQLIVGQQLLHHGLRGGQV